MASSLESLEKLNTAVGMLNDDAEGMHALIERSTNTLEATIAFEQQSSETMADTAGQLNTALEQLKQVLAEVEQVLQKMQAQTDTTLTTVSGNIQELQKTGADAFTKIELSLAAGQEELNRSVSAYEASVRQDAELSRSQIQSDLLAHQNALSARLDNVENTLVALRTSVQALTEPIESVRDDVKRSLTPVMGIGVATIVLEIVVIILLFVV